MLWRLDRQLISCVSVSLLCSVAPVVAAVVLGVPAALQLGRRTFPFRRGLVIAANTCMAVPTEVIGLVFYALLSRSGPLAWLGMLNTKKAIVIGELCLALPIVVALLSASVSKLDRQLEKTARTLGARELRIWWLILRESRTGLIAATMAVFGRVVSELGIATMLGGNIKALARTMTTAMALETQKGDFALALALGIVLLVIALGVNIIVQVIRGPQ